MIIRHQKLIFTTSLHYPRNRLGEWTGKSTNWTRLLYWWHTHGNPEFSKHTYKETDTCRIKEFLFRSKEFKLSTLVSNFSIRHKHWIKQQAQENKRNDHFFEKLLIFSLTLSPCHCHRKYIKSSIENIHADVRVLRGLRGNLTLNMMLVHMALPCVIMGSSPGPSQQSSSMHL